MTETETDSNLVKHAQRELEIIGEEPDIVAMYLNVVRAFVAFGHSGGSASVAIPVMTRLLSFQPLSDLTDDPDEWFFHGADVWGEEGGIWQNKRDSTAFSKDGGKTYTLLLADQEKGVETIHTSKTHTN